MQRNTIGQPAKGPHLLQRGGCVADGLAGVDASHGKERPGVVQRLLQGKSRRCLRTAHGTGAPGAGAGSVPAALTVANSLKASRCAFAAALSRSLSARICFSASVM